MKRYKREDIVKRRVTICHKKHETKGKKNNFGDHGCINVCWGTKATDTMDKLLNLNLCVRFASRAELTNVETIMVKLETVRTMSEFATFVISGKMKSKASSEFMNSLTVKENSTTYSLYSFYDLISTILLSCKV